MVLNEEQWIKELREKRIAYGISQGRLAVASGITREYLNKIESGKMKPSKELLETLYKELARFNPEAPLTMLFDYVKIRFTVVEPYKRWEFDMDNSNMKGHWIGIFTDKGNETQIDFTENVIPKKWFMKPFVKTYLKKQQKQFVLDLKKALE